jgi:imidazolonepropionase-like amidohydrolase
MTPVRALQAATLGPARWLDAEDRVGSIRPGRFADLLVVDEDPTADVSALRSLRWVMQGGRVVRDDAADPHGLRDGGRR